MVPVDVTFHPSWWHEHAGIDFSQRFFEDPAYRIDADMNMRRVLYERFGDLGFGEDDPKPRPLLDSDLLAGEYVQAQILGCDIRYSPDSLPEPLCLNLSAHEAEQLGVPDVRKTSAWESLERQIAWLYEQYGYVESFVDLHGVQNLALSIRGMQLFEDYYSRPELARHILTVCARTIAETATCLREVSECIGIGVTSIIRQVDKRLYVTSNCSLDMVSRDIYESFLLEHDAMLSRRFQPFGIHHCGGSFHRFAQIYAEISGVSFVEAGAFSDLKAARAAFPGTWINARYSPVRLRECSKEQLVGELKQMACDAQPASLLSFSCVGIDSDTDDQQVRLFLDIAKHLEESNDSCRQENTE